MPPSKHGPIAHFLSKAMHWLSTTFLEAFLAPNRMHNSRTLQDHTKF
jgi:hypothetical protein